MANVRRVSVEEFRRLPLEAHALLSDAPLRDVTCVHLPGGGAGRTLSDVRAVTPGGPFAAGGATAKTLFVIRTWLGKVFRWDGASKERAPSTYLSRLPLELAQRSTFSVGAEQGVFRVLYELPGESLVEVTNATVHALLCSALAPDGDGYSLYWAVYVIPVSRFTAVYMALIEPFRRFVVYPSVLGGVRRAWAERYAPASRGDGSGPHAAQT